MNKRCNRTLAVIEKVEVLGYLQKPFAKTRHHGDRLVWLHLPRSLFFSRLFPAQRAAAATMW